MVIIIVVMSVGTPNGGEPVIGAGKVKVPFTDES
jgi:hypothetical protein